MTLHKKTISFLVKGRLIFFILMIMSAGWTFSSFAIAKDMAEIQDIRLVNTRDDLLTYFKVTQAFSDKINQAILNGVPTTFSFYIELYKNDTTWLDKNISDIQIKSTIKYNSLKKEFSVLRPWKNENPVATQSFEEAKTLMTEIDNLIIIPLNRLTKGDKYQLRIKAELDKVTLPLSLHNIFFFVSYWNFETNWYLVNFSY
ncbi:MAG: hypothetical protein A2277_00870 [Desulfobacterales bacterium RIFOXYA12_FULL_46_15]|nr:MAG: hypothetical protein A2097_10275 [Desulfobacula sp. GWF2_41_7]OGR25683.1 MAG: hypothetical protein A2277_00870 [Desulfobacterales bacterium RIFOXYA12_FULL_46_15]